jgi:hypothetical protein
MKTQIQVITSAILTSVLLVGCATTSTQNTQTEQVVIETASDVATVAVLQKNPQYKPAFIEGAALLNVLAGSTNQLSVSSAESALNQFDFTNQYGALLTPIVINILNADLTNSGTNSVIQNAQVQQALSWIATGINEGLGSTLVKQ